MGNRLEFYFSNAKKALEEPKTATPTAGVRARNPIDLLLRREPPSRERLREILFRSKSGDGQDRRSERQKNFDRLCTDALGRILKAGQEPKRQNALIKRFSEEVNKLIEQNSKLGESFTNFLFANLHASGSEISAEDLVLTKIILAAHMSTHSLIFSLMTRANGAESAADKFLTICKEENLISPPKVQSLCAVFVKARSLSPEDHSNFARNLIAISRDADKTIGIISRALRHEIHNFDKQAETLIAQRNAETNNSDVVPADDYHEDGDTELLSDDTGDFNELADTLVGTSLRINSCQDLLLALYRQAPQPISRESIKQLIKSISFDQKHLESLTEIEDEDFDEDGSEYSLNYLTDEDLAGRILGYCAQIVEAGSSQYTKKDFVHDLRTIINEHLAYNDVRVPLLSDALMHLYYQDPSVATKLALKILQDEHSTSDYLLVDDLREIVFDILGTNTQLTDLMVEETNSPDPANCDNLEFCLKTAIKQEKALPQLQALLNHPELDFEALLDKAPILLKDSKYNFFDCQNAFCRQFDWNQNSLASQRMEEFVHSQQLDPETNQIEPIDVDSLPEGKFRDWLTHIDINKPPTIDPSLN